MGQFWNKQSKANLNHSLNTWMAKASIGLLSAITGSGIVIALEANSVKAQTSSLDGVNPCPRIYYTEPFNSNLPAPAGCPANGAGVRLPAPEDDITGAPVGEPDSQIVQGPADAMIMSVDGEIRIRLINTMNVPVNYYILGNTGLRYLSGGSREILTNLDAPIRLSFAREDDGFIATTMDMSDQGILEVQLNEAYDPENRDGALIILENGEVYTE
jgi:hypothetical protein